MRTIPGPVLENILMAKFLNNHVRVTLLIALIVLSLIIGCGDAAEYNQGANNNLEHALQLLEQGQLDRFYDIIRDEELPSVRAFFETEAKRGRAINFGALVNANIITTSNRATFKPDIKKVAQFVGISNENLCYMNATFYNIANSAFFDHLLEIDTLSSQDWDNRDPKLRTIADNVVRTLRELIYEIRLGTATTPERIATIRTRHIKSLDNLSDLELMTSLYRELLSSYSFGTVEVMSLNEQGGIVHKAHAYEKIRSKLNFSLYNAKAAVENFKIYDGYGMLGGLSCQKFRGSKDIVYLDAVLPLIDPWGKSARYLGLGIFDHRLNSADLRTPDPYLRWGELILAAPGSSPKIKIFHNVLELKADNSAEQIAMRKFKDPKTNTLIGQINRAVPIDPANTPYQLVGKSKHSSNHLIAELFRPSQNLWETHSFFGPPRFSKKVSRSNDGSYQDHLYYYQFTPLE